MSNANILIFGTMYLRYPEDAEVVNLWASLVRKQGADWMLIDSCSPTESLNELDKYIKPNIWSFDDNIGHLSRGGRDGWGRAFCKGIELAISGGYDYVAHIESDLLFKGRIETVVSMMRKSKIKVVSPRVSVIAGDVPRLETGLVIMDVRYLKEIDFVARYDWTVTQRIPCPEARVAAIFGGDWCVWGLPGGRNDRRDLNGKIREIYYLTHAPLNQLREFASCDLLSS